MQQALTLGIVAGQAKTAQALVKPVFKRDDAPRTIEEICQTWQTIVDVTAQILLGAPRAAVGHQVIMMITMPRFQSRDQVFFA
jgi:hypothetical protein